MPDKVKLIAPNVGDGDYSHAEVVALARWAAKAHEWFADFKLTHDQPNSLERREQRYVNVMIERAVGLLDEIDTTETPNA